MIVCSIDFTSSTLSIYEYFNYVTIISIKVRGELRSRRDR